jgi:hypothetical protein
VLAAFRAGFRATALRAPARLLPAELFFAAARRARGLRAIVRFLLVFAPFRAFPRALRAALRLAIAVVLSVPGFTLTVSG